MKKFLFKVLLFLIPVFIVFWIGVFAPTTPRASQSLLMSNISKDSLLKNTPSPRIIFVGGSNLSFGLNSKMIKDSLRLNPVNTAIHASIGIKFMIDHTLPFIKKGDIVLVVPEYSQYHRSLNYGSEELMRMVFDVDLNYLSYLNATQIINIIPFIPRYGLTKLKTNEYENLTVNNIYSVSSFNKFGDAQAHWEMQKKPFTPYKEINGEYNQAVIQYLEDFDSKLKDKGAVLLVSFPSFQAASFDNLGKEIFKVEQELKKTTLNVLGTAARYKINDSLLFDTPYHLIKQGVDYRTKLLIEDIKHAGD